LLLPLEKGGKETINLTTLLSDISVLLHSYDKSWLTPSHQLANGPFRLAALGTSSGTVVEDASYFRVRVKWHQL